MGTIYGNVFQLVVFCQSLSIALCRDSSTQQLVPSQQFGFVFARLELILIVAACYVVDNFILKSASCFS